MNEEFLAVGGKVVEQIQFHFRQFIPVITMAEMRKGHRRNVSVVLFVFSVGQTSSNCCFHTVTTHTLGTGSSPNVTDFWYSKRNANGKDRQEPFYFNRLWNQAKIHPRRKVRHKRTTCGGIGQKCLKGSRIMSILPLKTTASRKWNWTDSHASCGRSGWSFHCSIFAYPLQKLNSLFSSPNAKK